MTRFKSRNTVSIRLHNAIAKKIQQKQTLPDQQKQEEWGKGFLKKHYEEIVSTPSSSKQGSETPNKYIAGDSIGKSYLYIVSKEENQEKESPIYSSLEKTSQEDAAPNIDKQPSVLRYGYPTFKPVVGDFHYIPDFSGNCSDSGCLTLNQAAEYIDLTVTYDKGDC